MSAADAGQRITIMFMLDTDICIYTIKRKPIQVLNRLEMLEPGMVSMSAITFAELMNGAKKSSFVKDNIRRLNVLSELIEVLPFDKNAAIVYGDVRSGLEKRGAIIGGNDLLIAAHALSKELTLVTNNTKEFSWVDGLELENWATD
jgi:tRNA(fMet)-specific endonuclease VapC